MNAGNGWHTQQGIQRVTLRVSHEAVDGQLVRRRVHVRASGVVALEVQTVGRDDSEQGLQGRKCDGGFVGAGESGALPTDHAGLEG